MQDIYSENYKIPVKGIKKDLSKRRDILCSWIKSLNIVKTSISRELIHKLNAILIKIPAGYFIDTDKLIFKFRKKGNGTRITKPNLKKN